MTSTPELIDPIVRLSDRSQRAEAARALAARLGAESFLLFVRDPAVGSLIPAPGFPQTLRGGRAWRSFLAGCSTPGRSTGEVDLPAGTLRHALAVVSDDVAAILIGGDWNQDRLEALERLLPLLAATLVAEQQAVLAAAEAKEARDQASRARALAAALEAARAEASRLNAELDAEHRRKDDFLAMLAHELRNPLAPLVTAIELLRRSFSETDVAGRQLDVMTRQVGQLSRLIEDLLDVSRVSHGRIQLRRRRLALGEVLADALDTGRTLLESRRHEVVLSLPEEPLEVDGDPVRLTQVFANLLHNAAKYTDPGGRVTLSAVRDGEDAEVRVEDTGIGIAADMLPHIFDLFAQAPVSLARARGGLGIGLTLVRSLVELHGGRVTADSAGIGEGSTFVVRLPLARPSTEIAGSARSLPRARAAGDGLRVLIVDDNRDAADSLAAVLDHMGHHAEVAYSGLGALQAAADLDADLIFLDIGLPEMDGYEVLRRLRRMVPGGTQFVALTGYGGAADRRRCREAGFDEHVVKPLTVDKLEAILARVGQS